MDSEEEKRFLLLLTMIYLDGSGTKQKILDAIDEKSWIKLSPRQRAVMESRNEPRWRNDLAFVRHHLVLGGYVSDRTPGTWEITEKGTEYFHRLRRKVEQTNSNLFQHISNQALLGLQSINFTFPLISDENALTGETEFQEGAIKYYWTTRYERDPQLRARAIEIHGTTCMGCGFNFEQKYGEIGSGFIEVHHTKPVSALGGSAVVNPHSDMVTLCSNCHSIVHRKKSEPLTLHSLIALVNVGHHG